MGVLECLACGKISCIDRAPGEKINCPRCGNVIEVRSSPTNTNEVPTRIIDPTDLQRHSASTGYSEMLRPAEMPGEIGRIGNFRVLRVLGCGGMGMVFQAEDITLHRSVALKVILPHLKEDALVVERFLREARAMAKVTHKNVAPIYQITTDRGVPFFTMELLKGEPLDERLKREPILSLEEVVRIGIEVAEGLSAAHCLGLIHRDIKPANIWLERPKGNVRILDFGLVRPQVSAANQITKGGVVMGTPGFMAPEQARGGSVDERTDLFSLGVLLYRMATGRLPFVASNATDLLVATLNETPASPRSISSTIPANLDAIIMKLLAKQPEHRIQTAPETATALRHLESDASPPLPPEGERSRQKLAVTTVAAVAAIAIVFAVFWMLPGAYDDHTRSMQWGSPKNLGPAVNAGKRHQCATLTRDEKIIVFARDGRLWMAQRQSLNEPFDQPAPLPEAINRIAGESSSISGDGLLLVIGSRDDDIFLTSRSSINEAFGEPTRLPPPVNSDKRECNPVLSADGLTLLITTFDRGGAGGGDLTLFSRATRDDPFANEILLPSTVNTRGLEVPAWVSNNAQTLFVVSGNKAPRCFFRMTAEAPYDGGHDSTFLFPVRNPGRPWLSADGRRLYFHSPAFSRELSSNGEIDLWVAHRRESSSK